MKIKKLIPGLSGLALLATVAPIPSITTSQVTFTDSQNAQMQSVNLGNKLDVGNKLTEIESIYKSCENLVSYDLSKESDDIAFASISNIESRVKIEDGIETDVGVKDGKIESEDLFTCKRTDTQYATHYKYKNNNIKKNNHTSCGNAKKYQLNVTVPANTKEYKVEVVAETDITNYISGGTDIGGSFAQAKLSPLSTSVEDTLMPYIGIKNENTYTFNCSHFKIATHNDFFRLFSGHQTTTNPYEKAKLSSTITLTNETSEAKEIPVYFWYGFFGGGYTGEGEDSYINCSEVTFTAKQVTFSYPQNPQIQSLYVENNLTEIKSINKSCEKLLTFDLLPSEVSEASNISNIESRVKIEEEPENPAKEGKIERDDLFTCSSTDAECTSYWRYKSNHVEKNNHTSWGNAKKYQLNVIVPANTKEYKVEVVADVKIKNCIEGGLSDSYSFAQAKLSPLSTSAKETLMPYIGIKDDNVHLWDWNQLEFATQNDLFALFANSNPWERKPDTKAKLSSFITLSNETTEAKEIPVYFWYGFFGGGYAGERNGSHINCSEVTFSANQITPSYSQNVQRLEVVNNLTTIKTINKSCENLVTFDLSEEGENPEFYCNISNIESRVKIEDGIETDAKDGKIERDNLFTCNNEDTQYTSYWRYKSNDVEKNNHTSWGNAKKYQLNVAVPANTEEYKVQVVADVKIKNCIESGLGDSYSFAQAKLSQLSISPDETLMPYIGIKDDNVYSCYGKDFKIITHNDLFRLFGDNTLGEEKPYEKATLSSTITLSNETPEDKEIPIYFWYGFFGGGFTSEGNGSHINCSEVTFSANHIE